MDSNVEKRAGLKTGLVSMVCLLGATVGAYQLYLDLNEAGRIGFGTPVGKVQRREAKVRRKLGSSYVWTNVVPNEELYRKDSIQTGPGSAASIRLTDGSVLDIGESSLVVMDDSQNLALGFVRGSAVVHKADGDAKISVDKDGKAKVEELPARLLRPDSLARFFVTSKGGVAAKKAILFSWEIKKSSPGSTYQVQVSRDKKFLPDQTQTLSPEDPKIQQLTLELGSGNYYWRMFTSGVAQTETRQFKISTVNPIQGVYPAPNDVVSATADTGVQFRWVALRAGEDEESELSLGTHEIEVAQDAEFKKIISSNSIEVTNGLAIVRGLGDGQYFWRIRSSYPDLNIFGNGRAFSIRNRPQASLLPFPASVRPENGAVLNPLNEKTPLEASWSGVEGADSYEVSVFQPAAGGVGQNKEIAHLKTEKTLLSLKNLKPGDYLWTIRTVDKEKRAGDSLPMRTFKISTGEPLAPPEVVTQEVQ